VESIFFPTHKPPGRALGVIPNLVLSPPQGSYILIARLRLDATSLPGNKPEMRPLAPFRPTPLPLSPNDIQTLGDPLPFEKTPPEEFSSWIVFF